MHKSITEERVIALSEESMFGLGSPGLCKACGEEQEGCEPDARNYTCEACGEAQVFGAEDLLFDFA
jgi:hypothetical protein